MKQLSSTSKRSRSRPRLKATGFLVLAGILVLTACGDDADTDTTDTDTTEVDEADEADEVDEVDDDAAAEDDTWYERGLRIITPVSPGGGLGQNLQAMRQPLTENFGGPIVIEHIPGGGMSIGTSVASDTLGDCTSALYTVTVTHLLLDLVEDVDYSVDDFRPVLTHVADPYVFLVPEDSPYETFSDFVADARERPGEITVGVHSFADTNVTQLMEMEDQLGLEFNMVLYGGGGPARQSLVSGETDFSYPVLFPSLNIRETTRAIGYWEDPDTAPDADLSGMYDGSDPLEEQEPDLDLTGPGSTYSLWVNQACFEDYPERYEHIERAFLDTFEDEGYLETMESLGLRDALAVIPGDETARIIEEVRPGVVDLAERYVLPAIAGGR